MVDSKQHAEIALAFVNEHLKVLCGEVLDLHGGQYIDSSWKLQELRRLCEFAGTTKNSLAETIISTVAMKNIAERE